MSAHENDTDPEDSVSRSDFATTEPDAPLPLARSETPTIPPAMPSKSRLSPSKLASAPPKPPPPRRTSSGPMAAAKEPEPPSSRRTNRPRPAQDTGDQLIAGLATARTPPPRQTAESAGEASAVYHGAGTAVPVPLSHVEMRDEPSVIVSEPPPALAKTSRFERDDVQKGLAEVAVRAAAARAAGLPTGRTAMKTLVTDPRVVARRSMIAVVAGLAVVLFMLGGVWWSRRDDPPAAIATPVPTTGPAVDPGPIPAPVGREPVQPPVDPRQPSTQSPAETTVAPPVAPASSATPPTRPVPPGTQKTKPAATGDLLEHAP